MKKIVSRLIFLILLQSTYSARASLEKQLRALSNTLVALEQVLTKPKTEKELEQEFVQLFKKAQEIALVQKKQFDETLNYLKNINPQKKVFGIYLKVKKMITNSSQTDGKLSELINKIYVMQTYPIIDNKFAQQIIALYQQIKQDWQNYADEFDKFVKTNQELERFNEEVSFTEGEVEVENFTLNLYFNELNNLILENNKILQDLLNNYRNELENKKAIEERLKVARDMLELFNTQGEVFLQTLEKFRTQYQLTKEDFEELEQADPNIILHRSNLQSFVDFLENVESFPDVYQEIYRSLHVFNNDIKKFSKKVTDFYRDNYQELTPLYYKKSNGETIYLISFIDKIKKNLDDWRNKTLYMSVGKPIEDALKIKKQEW